MRTRKMLTRLSCAVGVFALANCGPGTSNAQRDAATGALIGGAAGAAIGHQSGNTAEGAAIGAGVGAAGGYAVGNEKDKRRNYNY